MKTMLIQGKSDKYGNVIRVEGKWIKVTKELYDQFKKDQSYEVDDKITEILTVLKEKEKKPFYEEKIKENTKGDFRSPDQIMRSSALGLASSFVAQIYQHDIEIGWDKLQEKVFELTDKYLKIIEG